MRDRCVETATHQELASTESTQNTRPQKKAGLCEQRAVNDEKQLIAETLAGNAAAFEQLVLRYQDRLFNAMTHVATAREEAEDVVQEAFIQAYLKLKSFQQTSSFFTWLYRIAFNLAISRKRKRREECSVDEHREQTGREAVDGGEDAAERVLREERAVQVRSALDRLSDEHRAILVLREIEGCDYETISAILDLPVGTVRSRIHRARMQLREQLQPLLEESTT